MGLLPLEFTDGLTDSPYFREKIQSHERELDRMSHAIKNLIKEVKDLLTAARTLSRAQRSVSDTLSNFSFECIGSSQTDDEIIIAGSLKEFGRLLSTIEDERDRMLERAHATFIEPIEKFRREQIGGAKEVKKKFDKETARFCQSLERHLNLSTKKSENHLQEADASLEMEQRHFFQASSEYVLKLQEVNERKKFEFVETVLSFMYGWLTFYHQGHEVAKEFKSIITDLQIRLQRTRVNYETTQNETESLMNKMLEVRKNKLQDSGALNKMYTRQGYLFLMEKKAFGTSWAKHFCQYDKENRRFTMIQYNQTVGKIVSTEDITLKECIRRMSDSIDKRFCFDLIPVEKPNCLYTFQALSEEDRKLWLDAMDGKEPIQMNSSIGINSGKPLVQRQEECLLDDLGFAFVQKCIQIIERRGLEDQGLYRVVGVASKVNRLIQLCLDRRKMSTNELYDFDNSDEWETKTITSALKTYFRNLPEPLMTFRLHIAFIAAAKQENKVQRIETIHALIHKLPSLNFEMLHLLVRHLCKVGSHCEKNLMTVSNLGVCFGPTLLRPEEETVAAIMDIKFGNVVVELLIDNCDKIFGTKPDNGFHSRGSPSDAIQQMNANTFITQMSAANNQSNVLYQRVPLQYDNNSTYAAIRGPIRSTSQDQLGISNQMGPQQYRRPLYQHSLSHSHPMTSSFPPPPNTVSYAQSIQNLQQQQQQHYVQFPNGPQSLQRAVRPIAVFNQWNSQPNVVHPQQIHHQVMENHKEKSPSTSTSSGDSLANSYPQSQQQNASPNSSSASSYPNAKSYYNYRPQLIAAPSVQSISSTNSRKVRTRYACVGENDSELSFEPNMIIMNVRPSREPGWLEGCLNGKTGLIPENYVEYID